jgi:two-component system phosphate regulon sensor histidine kinase PhoR
MLQTWRIRWYVIFAVIPIFMLLNGILFVAFDLRWAALGQLLAMTLLVAGGALLYRDTRRELEQRQVLLRVSEGLAARGELDELLDYIVNATLQLIPQADKCVIHLLDESARRLYARYSSRPEWTPSVGIPANKGIAGQALSELRTKVVPDVRQDDLFLPLKSSADLRSLMVAPLYIRDKPLGTMSLNSRVAAAFGERDQLLLTTLAAQTSAALYQNRLYNAALDETQHVEIIISTLPDGLIVLDAENRILRHNPAAAHIFGATTPSIVGQRVDVSSPFEGLRRLATTLAAHPTQEHHTYGHVLRLEQPVSTLLKVQVSPVLDREGNWRKIVLLHDETEELESLQAKCAFATTATGELTPLLESIRGYTNLILTSPAHASDPVRQWAAQIRQQSARLMRLIEDLALLFAVDGGYAPVPSRDVDVRALLTSVMAESEPSALLKGLQIEIQCPEHLPPLPFDADRIRHVLLHLLENAIHRGRQGGRIRIKVEATLDEVLFVLSDDGKAIADDVRMRVSQGRYSPYGALPRDPVGAGLGLFISRKLVEAHGGQLWLAETVGAEVKVQFMLPLRGA